MKTKLNLGCGKEIKKEYVNLDKIRLDGVDVVHDLEVLPYPFKAGTFEEIFCKHILEHVDDLIRVMEELHRIAKPRGRIKVIAPYFAGHGAFNDPTHRRFFTYKTFEYFGEDGYYAKATFRTLKRRIFFFSSRSFMKGKWFSLPFDFFINLCPTLYQRFFCWVYPAAEVHYLLEARK